MPYLGKVSGQANESTMELLYQLGIVQDSGTRLRFVFDAYFFYIDIERVNLWHLTFILLYDVFIKLR